ncbi:hypothetical protein [Pseudomonas sp. NC02]|uniref:hypothetical protein n=1 Tax=Pseudomonas sp. NC02 TaxID=2067572 RepID=UPI000C829C35|nr:hypothetical protein [Pseudomonas sp. NC02]AUO23201.1 hypothetical protein C0058_14905 [Pseudomonas sp. NC02]
MEHGQCKLCGSAGELKLSHFIPKFVGKWVKETSATGFIRFNGDINKRAQDIAKDYWLCGVCEQLFSGWEREFANRIFYPFVKGEADSVSYGDWLAKFCASISWRTLSYMRHLNVRGDTEQSEKEALALNGLANFILGNSKSPGIYEQHIFPLEPIETTNADVPVNINRYFLRNMHMDVLSSSAGELMIYTKMPKFIILGLAGHSQSKLMRASRVSIKGGKISPTSYFWPDGFAQYLFEKAKKVSDLYKGMAPAQHGIIERALMKNPDRAASSGTIKAFQHDVEMFGRKVFLPGDGTSSE